MKSKFVLDRKALIKNLESYDIDENLEILDVSLARYLVHSSHKMETYLAPTSQTELDSEGEKYLEEFDEKTLYLWKEVESPLTTVLAKMEVDGVYVDKQKLQQTAEIMKRQLAEISANIRHILGEEININSPQQLGVALVGQGFVLKKSKTGAISTSKEVLDGLLEDDQTGLVQLILKYRTINKLIGTYTQNLIDVLDENSRIHCTFNQTQAATGRLSSVDPNLQNIPIRNLEFGSLIRSCFCAPDSSRVILSADYSQVELRILAHISGDKNLIDAFQFDQDVHKRTAAEMLGITISDVTKEQRTLGKTLNFALVYQQGSFATSKMLGITMAEAKDFTEKYFSAFPAVKPLVDSVLIDAKNRGYVESIFGRRRYFQNLNSKMFMLRQIDERAAFNAVLQGSNADLIKIAMIEIYRQIQYRGLDAKMVLQVHDELVFEVSKDCVEELRELVVKIMSNPPIDLAVAIKVDTSVGDSWIKE